MTTQPLTPGQIQAIRQGMHALRTAENDAIDAEVAKPDDAIKAEVAPSRPPTLLELEVAIDLIPDDLIKEQFLGLIQRCVKAEHLLRRIWSARLAFSVDSGGPATPADGMVVIEGWIQSFFEGSYYEGITIEISEIDR
jgi:hypothetical protein